VRVHTDNATDLGETVAAEETSEPVESKTQASKRTEDSGGAENSGGVEDTSGAEEITEADDAACEDSSDSPNADEGKEAEAAKTNKRRINWPRVVAYGVIPGLALLAAAAAGFLKWQDTSARDSKMAAVESLAAAKDSSAALLSYQPDSADKDLGAAKDRLTGAFKESHTKLTHDVIIPGAKQRHISAIATVPAAASVSATPNHAVALIFVDQTVVIGNDAPTDTASTIRVTLDKIGGRWLISGFDPI